MLWWLIAWSPCGLILRKTSRHWLCLLSWIAIWLFWLVVSYQLACAASVDFVLAIDWINQQDLAWVLIDLIHIVQVASWWLLVLVSVSLVPSISIFFLHSILSWFRFLQVWWLARIFWLGFVIGSFIRLFWLFVSLLFILALTVKRIDVLDEVLDELCFIEILWLLFMQAPRFVLLVCSVSQLSMWCACSLAICLRLSVVVRSRSIIVRVLATSCPSWPCSFLRSYRAIGSIRWLTVWFDDLLRLVESEYWQLLISVALHLLMVVKLPSAILKRLHFVAEGMLLAE